MRLHNLVWVARVQQLHLGGFHCCVHSLYGWFVKTTPQAFAHIKNRENHALSIVNLVLKVAQAAFKAFDPNQ